MDLSPKGRMWIHGASAFALTRLYVLAGAACVAVFKAKADPLTALKEATATKDVINVLGGWDAAWYTRIVEHGYPRRIPADVTYFQDEARAAFFPLYPRIAHYLDPILPGQGRAAALVLAWIAGAVAVALIGMLAAAFYGARVGGRAMVVACFFPGSFVLSFAYSEGVMLALVAACLLALDRRHWVLAGLAAGLATAARPNALAVVLACAVAAFVAIRDERDWLALSAPLLAPLGYLGFHAFLWHHTGEGASWFRVQREAWDEGVSLGGTALRGVWNAFLHPVSSPGHTITLFTMALLVGMVLASRRARLPAPWWAYSLGIIVLMLLPSTVAPRPRFLFSAFPLLIGVAAWWPERDRDWWAYTMSVCSAALVALVALYGGQGAIP